MMSVDVKREVHWFLIVIDLQHRRVDLLDSLPLNKSNDYRRESAEELLRSSVQYSMRSSNLTHLFGAASNFPMHVAPVASQADGSNDCGMHVIKYMEADSEYDWCRPLKNMEEEQLRKICDLWRSDNNDFR
uniref:Ubiquitin-like protease family profile domain-containing protein n=1 Tax=Opuntia streptacantha TaxID=393608 RepID=A0A7C9DLW6_OPUST